MAAIGWHRKMKKLRHCCPIYSTLFTVDQYNSKKNTRERDRKKNDKKISENSILIIREIQTLDATRRSQKLHKLGLYIVIDF